MGMGWGICACRSRVLFLFSQNPSPRGGSIIRMTPGLRSAQVTGPTTSAASTKATGQSSVSHDRDSLLSLYDIPRSTIDWPSPKHFSSCTRILPAHARMSPLQMCPHGNSATLEQRTFSGFLHHRPGIFRNIDSHSSCTRVGDAANLQPACVRSA